LGGGQKGPGNSHDLIIRLLENLTISELTSKQEKWNFSLKKNF
jgi:hypothetical protein